MVLLIDNYDSFSFNLYQLVGSIDPDIKVIRSDELTVEEIAEADRRILEDINKTKFEEFKNKKR